MKQLANGKFRVSEAAPLARALRTLFPGTAWTRARRAIESGKISVDGVFVLDPGARVAAGATLEVRLGAPSPRRSAELSDEAIVFVDSSLVVLNKPAGVSSVPFEPGDEQALSELARRALRRRERRAIPPLGVVQRIDKETSGLIVFARTLGAKRELKQEFRFHRVHRRYLALVHGTVAATRFESRFVKNRGDGLRGSTDNPTLGRVAVTHVRPLERLDGATLVECRLETGRTHQIRIHLSEAGHPLVGERVYVRGFGGPMLEAPRLMLHAAELGFVHPISRKQLDFGTPMPADMERVLARLRLR